MAKEKRKKKEKALIENGFVPTHRTKKRIKMYKMSMLNEGVDMIRGH